MAQKSTYVTREELKQLKVELEYLKGVSRPQVAERIQRSKEVGGTEDNPEYDEAKKEQAFIEGHIQALVKKTMNAVIWRLHHLR